MVWPTFRSRTAEEQNRTLSSPVMLAVIWAPDFAGLTWLHFEYFVQDANTRGLTWYLSVVSDAVQLRR